MKYLSSPFRVLTASAVICFIPTAAQAQDATSAGQPADGASQSTSGQSSTPQSGVVNPSAQLPTGAGQAPSNGTFSTVPPAPTPYPYTIQHTHSYWQTHGFDLAASATGRYQQVVTDQFPARTSPTEGVGVLVNIREHPVSWFGLEVNYSYNRYSERYTSATTGAALGRVNQDQNEATAGYVFHFKVPGVQPFITLGGGALNFGPTKGYGNYANQWRGTYMYEVGFDFVSRSHPHFGVRVQEHGLFYKAPDFYVGSFRSNGYIHQAMPSAGVFYRF